MSSPTDVGETGSTAGGPLEDYERSRSQLEEEEKKTRFDYPCEAKATELEKEANEIVHSRKIADKEEIYARAEPRRALTDDTIRELWSMATGGPPRGERKFTETDK